MFKNLKEYIKNFFLPSGYVEIPREHLERGVLVFNPDGTCDLHVKAREEEKTV